MACFATWPESCFFINTFWSSCFIHQRQTSSAAITQTVIRRKTLEFLNIVFKKYNS